MLIIVTIAMNKMHVLIAIVSISMYFEYKNIFKRI